MKDFDVLFANGNFGVMHTSNAEQENFVVVNDKIIYQSGGWDNVNSFKNDKLCFDDDWYIEYICQARCFDIICEVSTNARLYDRERDTKEKEIKNNMIYEICYETCDGEIFKCDTAEELLEDVKSFIENHSSEKNGCIRITVDKIY